MRRERKRAINSLMDRTIEYYTQNADAYVASTVNVEFRGMQERFLRAIPAGGRILDFGCGSGRDTKYFLEKGYQVMAVDGVEELCRLAAAYTGIPVRKMLFQELDEVGVYDGIWACSSILHLTYGELKNVMRKMARALKPEGIVYTSFKYGEFEGERNGRYFTDMTEERLDGLLREVEAFTLVEEWVTKDVRPGRGDERWMNVLLKKIIV